MLHSTLRTAKPWSRDLTELFRSAGSTQCSRCISTNSAIARGLRDTSAAERRYRGDKYRPLFRKELAKYDRKRGNEYDQARKEAARRDAQAVKAAKARQAILRHAGRDQDLERSMALEEQLSTGEVLREADNKTDGPVAVPHTTAASQFLYGFSAVKAALATKRRNMYKLYLHERAFNRARSTAVRINRPVKPQPGENDEDNGAVLYSLAQKIPGLQVVKVEDNFLPVLARMSKDRPHNGCVLEASALPTRPILALRPATRAQPHFLFDLDKQSREEKRVNGTGTRLPYNSHGWRFPFVLYLDGIVDEGNIGAIIRSAYYLGVDAIITSKRSTAPIGAHAIKASSGAAEAMPLLSVENPLAFLTRSTLNGWRVYAAGALPPPVDDFNIIDDPKERRALDPVNTSPLVSYSRPHSGAVLRKHTPLADHPAILMLGSESSGFRESLRSKANYFVGIRGIKGAEIGLDSLNVSVAAAIVMMEMLKKPEVVTRREKGVVHEDDTVQNDELLF